MGEMAFAEDSASLMPTEYSQVGPLSQRYKSIIFGEGGARVDQIGEQIVFFLCLDLYLKSPVSDERQYKSTTGKGQFDLALRAGGRIRPYKLKKSKTVCCARAAQALAD